MPAMIKAITFDLDGVYFPDGKARFIDALNQRGVSEADAKRVFMNSPQMNQQYKLGHMTDDGFWTWAAGEWKLDTRPTELMQLLVDSYTVDERVAEVVRTVRRHGYMTLICTSNFPARIRGLQERFGFLDDFDVAVFSYEVQAPKPSPEIFAELIKRAGVPADAIVFADDHVDNVEAAQAAGITAFVYEDFDGFLARLKELGVQL
jgi:2-haloacid dehalogenase